MSTSLYWDIVRPVKHKGLSDQLKYIIAPVYWDHDGSLWGDVVVLNTDQLSYLCGIRDGSRDEEVKESCKTLIEAIQKNGSIKIWIES